MTTTQIAQVSLEWWRASGERTIDRLNNLVEHYATINGELAYLDHHRQSALAATRSWEIAA
jgi:hypothetical protein